MIPGDGIGDPGELSVDRARDLDVQAGRLVLPRVQFPCRRPTTGFASDGRSGVPAPAGREEFAHHVVVGLRPGAACGGPPLVGLCGGLDLGFLDLVGGGVPLDGAQAQVVVHRDDDGLGSADADHVVLWLGLDRLHAHGVHRTAPYRGNPAGLPWPVGTSKFGNGAMVAEGAVLVTGMKGPLEDGWQNKVTAFADQIMSTATTQPG